MSTYSEFASNLAQLTQAGANAQARGINERGQIWGQAIGNLGQIAAQIPAQYHQQKIVDVLKAHNGDVDAALPEIMQIDPGLGSSLSQRLMEAKKTAYEFQIKKWEHDKAGLDFARNLVASATDPESYAQMLYTAKLVGADTSAFPTTYDPKFIESTNRSFMTGQQRLEENKPVFETAAPGATIYNKKTGVPTATLPGAQKTEAELAADAANPQSATAAQSKSALELLQDMKGGTAEQDDQRYRNIRAKLLPQTPDNLAWAKAYEQQKTLVTDTGAAAATDRQTRTIAAQAAQQARAQGFTEAQAGRKELTDKVEQPYLDAQEKASTLRTVVDAAKRGNMEAASVQSLLGTLGLVTSEGIKRINITELQSVAGAGSLLERIKSQVGNLTAGQKLSPKLQNDLVELAGLMEQSARKKYVAGHEAVTKRYGLKDEPVLPAPDTSGTTTGKKVGRFEIVSEE